MQNRKLSIIRDKTTLYSNNIKIVTLLAFQVDESLNTFAFKPSLQHLSSARLMTFLLKSKLPVMKLQISSNSFLAVFDNRQ